MTESELYQNHIKALYKRQGRFFIRIDHPRLPDIYTIRPSGVPEWVELKCINRRQKIIRPAWRPGQLAWIKAHERVAKHLTTLCLYYCGKVFWLAPKETYTEEEINFTEGGTRIK